MVLALAPRINHVFVYIAPTSYSDNLLATLTTAAEEDQAQSSASATASRRPCRRFADSFSVYQSLFNAEEQVYERMAAQGQSMFVSAGDTGAYDDGADLSVSDVASPPTVTAVGGTTLSVTNTARRRHRCCYEGESTWGNPAEGIGQPKGAAAAAASATSGPSPATSTRTRPPGRARSALAAGSPRPCATCRTCP